MSKIDMQRQAVMQKCGCKKTECDPNKRHCVCVKKGKACTILCKCIGCRNTDVPVRQDQHASSSDSDSTSSDSDSIDGTDSSMSSFPIVTNDNQYEI